MHSRVALLPERPVPISLLPLILPLAGDRVQAGFPSPAEDFNCKRIDLTEQLVQHPQATFLLRVRGDSMREAGIFDGDVLVVDRAIRAAHGHVVVAVLDGGDFTVKYLHKRAERIRLVAANPTYPDIVPRDGQVLEIWGVVTASIKQFKA
ncbi:translesion error-prone DNA polymerase V autoproteolytic subunit [Xylophilus rhododendri]|uniref:Translesion error-prone DNA polymerase V autoproteolytic subunit n=1 Tax=Xylophilus rhododendri TaxID=2697032 RepID=A0A857J9G4_9BURK|nr:translesion error-prone DNA polymerase V autoproteolytic subunit [Xylophilus rhododendri]QHI99378.1 translesion error-prone DNA polymerase V autoproteolytic subunit [Xylophilus rhododendri]